MKPSKFQQAETVVKLSLKVSKLSTRRQQAVFQLPIIYSSAARINIFNSLYLHLSGIHHTIPEDGSLLKVDQMHLWCIMEVDGEWSVCGWVSLGDILLAVILHWTHITYRCTPASPCRYAVNISTQLFSS